LNFSADDESLVTQVLNKIFSNTHYNNSDENQISTNAFKILRAMKWAGFFNNTIPVKKDIKEITCR
jgi:hypothetical protein